MPAFGKTRRLTSGKLYFRLTYSSTHEFTVDLFRPGLSSGAPEEYPVPGLSVVMSTPHSDGFTGYIEATGGADDFGNDVTGELSPAVNSSVSYYKITYAPENHNFDGQFRRIRVTVKLQTDLSIATFEAMPFSAIGATVKQVDRTRAQRNMADSRPGSC